MSSGVPSSSSALPVVQITAKAFVTIVFLFSLCWFLYKIQEALFLLFFAFVLSAALYPPINWLKHRRFPSHLSILIFYLAFIVFVTLMGFLLSNMLMEEWQQFLLHVPMYLNQAQHTLDQLPFVPGNTDLLSELSNNMRTILAQGVHVALSSLGYVFGLVKVFIGIATILVFTFFFLSDTEYFETALLRLIPTEHRDGVDRLVRRLIDKIGAYVRGQFIIMCIIGTLIWLTLTMLGVPYALMLGIIGFALDAIPIVGPVISGIFGTLIALGHDPISAVWVGIAYYIIQHLESYFLSPTILGRSLGLHPFWILISILLSELMLGVKGLLIAVPLGVTISLLIESCYIEGFLKRTEPSS